MLRDIVLHGALRKEFGARFRLDVANPLEAFRALFAQLPGFRERIEEGEFTIVRGKKPTDGWALDRDALDFPLGKDPLHIVPVASGSGKGGSVLKTVIGVLIVAAAFYFAPPAGPEAAGAVFGADLAATSAVWISYGTMATIGVGLAASGIAGLLAPTPKFRMEERDSRQSFLFNNMANVTTQGVPLPLIYGRMRVGSVVISSSLETVESDGSRF
jgi:predicted phage tail protein